LEKRVQVTDISLTDLRQKMGKIIQRVTSLKPQAANNLAEILITDLGLEEKPLSNPFPFRVYPVEFLTPSADDATVHSELCDMLSGLRDDHPEVIVEWRMAGESRLCSGPLARDIFDSDVEYPDKGDPRLADVIPPQLTISCVVQPGNLQASYSNLNEIVEAAKDLAEKHEAHEILGGPVMFCSGTGRYYLLTLEPVVRPAPYAQAAEAVKEWNRQENPGIQLPNPQPQWQG
jgi:hypothetical protein